jgi:hypothetical protein
MFARITGSAVGVLNPLEGFPIVTVTFTIFLTLMYIAVKIIRREKIAKYINLKNTRYSI